MGRVPIPTYRQRTTPDGVAIQQPQGGRQSQTGSIVQALGNVAQGVREMAGAANAEAEADLRVMRLMDAKAEDDARAFSSAALAKTQAMSSQFLREAADEAPDGWRDLTKAFDKRLSDHRAKIMETAPTQIARDYLERQLNDFSWRATQQAAETEDRRRKEWRVTSFEQSVDDRSGAIASDPGLFDTSLGQLRAEIDGVQDLDAITRAKILDTGARRFAVSAVDGLVQRDPGSTLRALRDPKAQGPYQYLDGQSKRALINRAEAEIRSREAEARARLRDEVSTQMDLMRLGVEPENPIPRSRIASVMGQAAADGYDLMRLVVGNKRAMQGMTDDQLMQLAMESEPPPSRDVYSTQANRATIEAARSILKERSEDPLNYFRSQGMGMGMGDAGLTPVMEAFTQGDGKAVERFFRMREATVAQGAETFGTRAGPTLTRQEASALGSMVEQMTPTQQASLFMNMRKGFSNDVQYMTTVKAVVGDSAPMQIAAYAFTRGGRAGGDGPTGAQAGDALLLGARLLRPETAQPGENGGRAGPNTPAFKMPNEATMRAYWTSQVVDAYRGIPEAEPGSYAAFRAAYAGLAAQAGKLGDQPDREIQLKALQIATGGIHVRAGNRTLLPWGTDAANFETMIRNEWPSIRARNNLPASVRMEDVDFVAAGQGRYYLTINDQRLVNPQTGRDAFVDVRDR